MATTPAPQSANRFLYLLVICFVAALGGLLFGFDTAVISGSDPFFTREFGLSPQMEGWVVGSAIVGCFWGALAAGVMSDRFGRKKVLLLSAVFFTGSAIWCGLARTAQDLVYARLLGGLGIGIASLVSPLYIAEISPPRLRGRLVALQQLAIVLGILGAFFSNSEVLKTAMADAEKWRWMLAIGAFPAALFFVLILPIPESPRWLTQQGMPDKARAILTRVAGEQEAEAEMARITDAIAPGGQMPISQVLFSFTGRIGLATFWEVSVPIFSLNVMIAVVGSLLAAKVQTLGLLVLLLWLPIFLWTGLAIQAKRWHDRGKSEWMILISFIPIVGWIWSVVELGFLRGKPGRNQYGEDPNEGGRALFVGVTLAVLTQITGINAIMYYAPKVFEQAGFVAADAYGHSIWVGLTNLVFTVAAMVLVDRMGRKPLLLIGATCMGLALSFVGYAFYSQVAGGGVLVGVLVYVASFAFSMGVVGWVLISEIYPTRTRGRAMALATSAVWGACYLVSQTFPMLINKQGPLGDHAGPHLAFWLYAAMCAVALVFIGWFVPETKGRSLEEIERSWG